MKEKNGFKGYYIGIFFLFISSSSMSNNSNVATLAAISQHEKHEKHEEIVEYCLNFLILNCFVKEKYQFYSDALNQGEIEKLLKRVRIDYLNSLSSRKKRNSSKLTKYLLISLGLFTLVILVYHFYPDLVEKINATKFKQPLLKKHLQYGNVFDAGVQIDVRMRDISEIFG